LHVIIGITGASGAAYGIRLAEILKKEAAIILSEAGLGIVNDETGLDKEYLKGLASNIYSNDDLHSDIASGSSLFDAMVIVPCTTNTMSKIANGIADNLITRCASVCLKESRKLVLLIRETPLSPIHLENMLRLSNIGVTIMPASPGFYSSPKTIDDIIDFIAARILDNIGYANEVSPRWGNE